MHFGRGGASGGLRFPPDRLCVSYSTTNSQFWILLGKRWLLPPGACRARFLLCFTGSTSCATGVQFFPTIHEDGSRLLCIEPKCFTEFDIRQIRVGISVRVSDEVVNMSNVFVAI